MTTSFCPHSPVGLCPECDALTERLWGRYPRLVIRDAARDPDIGQARELPEPLKVHHRSYEQGCKEAWREGFAMGAGLIGLAALIIVVLL